MRSCGNIQARPTPRLYIRPRYGDPFFNTPATVGAALASGAYELVVVDGGTVGPDSAAVAAGIVSGAYVSVVVATDAPANAAALAASLTSGDYALVVVAATAPANSAQLSASLLSGSYALAS